MSDKTCDNCNHRPGSCMDRDVFSDENGDCQSWQPASVATTDVKSNVPWHHMDAPTKLKHFDGQLRGESKDGMWVFAKEAHEAIAKRDDLIRRMADALNGCYLTDYIDDTAFDLMAEVNELMGVK